MSDTVQSIQECYDSNPIVSARVPQRYRNLYDKIGTTGYEWMIRLLMSDEIDPEQNARLTNLLFSRETDENNFVSSVIDVKLLGLKLNEVIRQIQNRDHPNHKTLRLFSKIPVKLDPDGLTMYSASGKKKTRKLEEYTDAEKVIIQQWAQRSSNILDVMESIHSWILNVHVRSTTQIIDDLAVNVYMYAQPWLPIRRVYDLKHYHQDVYTGTISNHTGNATSTIYVHPLTLNILLPDFQIILFGKLEGDIFYTDDTILHERLLYYHTLCEP
jgi:hypothetical protein